MDLLEVGLLGKCVAVAERHVDYAVVDEGGEHAHRGSF